MASDIPSLPELPLAVEEALASYRLNWGPKEDQNKRWQMYLSRVHRAVAAELHLACARGAERTADLTYEETQTFASKLRAQAAAIEAGGGKEKP